jgi:hypothetical protein
VSCFIFCNAECHYAECRGAAYVLNFETSEQKAHLHIRRKQSKFAFRFDFKFEFWQAATV